MQFLFFVFLLFFVFFVNMTLLLVFSGWMACLFMKMCQYGVGMGGWLRALLERNIVCVCVVSVCPLFPDCKPPVEC